MYREDLKMLDGIDYYYDDNEEQEQDNHIDYDDLEYDVEPDWQRALNDYERCFERYN